MGNTSSVLKNAKTDLRFLILGLDNAGKTTILKAISNEDPTITQPTQGLNAKTVAFGKSKLQCYDVGGQQSVRQYWKHYFKNTNCLVFVVDAADANRLEEVSVELNICAESEELVNVPILVFSNKSDIPTALTAAEIAQKLQLTNLRGHKWQIQECSALNGTGIDEGFQWAVSQV
ncbi:ADP-ribosylation factor like protein 2a [Spironucleus salmonicida]|uniref:ADP-ribosylation factor n=1 Tax=Spironucleus salmonicida TaxID=348837 RepID=V6M3W7_9EUKA|nr:ADP-ribosylation factor like protein 2a [Spironucleus salmonicida]|eukprot:EST48009.1 ADP-ribosylation factor [Spironucleus salmonicida]